MTDKIEKRTLRVWVGGGDGIHVDMEQGEGVSGFGFGYTCKEAVESALHNYESHTGVPLGDHDVSIAEPIEVAAAEGRNVLRRLEHESYRLAQHYVAAAPRGAIDRAETERSLLLMLTEANGHAHAKLHLHGHEVGTVTRWLGTAERWSAFGCGVCGTYEDGPSAIAAIVATPRFADLARQRSAWKRVGRWVTLAAVCTAATLITSAATCACGAEDTSVAFSTLDAAP